MAELPYRSTDTRSSRAVQDGPLPNQLQIETPARSVRVLYVLGLFSLLISSFQSSWVVLAAGGSPLLLLFSLGGTVMSIVVIGRAVQVMIGVGVLDAPLAQRGFIHWCRRIGLWLMAAGALVALLQLLLVPITGAIFGPPSGNGIEYFVVGVGMAAFSGLGSTGVLLFELSRMLGFERWLRQEHSSGNDARC
jgi:hypothetical protein